MLIKSLKMNNVRKEARQDSCKSGEEVYLHSIQVLRRIGTNPLNF